MTVSRIRGTFETTMETLDFLRTKFTHFKYIYVVLAFAIAVLYDLLRWHAAAGLSFVVLIACYLAGFLLLAHTTKQLRQPRAHLLLIPIVALTLSVALYNNDYVQYSVPFVTEVLVIIYSLLVTLRPSAHPFGFLHIPAFRGPGAWFRNLAAVIRDIFTFRKQTANIVVMIGLGLIIAVPILLVFTGLFRSADPIFDTWMSTHFDFSFDFKFISETVWRIIRAIALTGFFGALFYIALSDDHTLVERVVRAKRYNSIVAAVILLFVNILFALFAFIQVKYLFLSSSAVIESGRTFADVARQGFFQLTWVLIFAGILLATIYRSYSYHDHPRLLKALELLFVLFIVVVALSALKRMNLYQQEFGFTVMRLYVEWFIYAVLGLLAIVFVSIFRNWQFRRFIHTSLIFALVVFSCVSLVNVDRAIARENIDRHLIDKKTVDIAYLGTLSVDALPEVQRLFASQFVPESCDHTLQVFSKKLTDAQDRAQSWRQLNVGVIQALTLTNLRTSLDQLEIQCRTEWFSAAKKNIVTNRSFDCGSQQGDCSKFVSNGRKPLSYNVSIINYDPPNVRAMTLISRSTTNPSVWFATVLISNEGGEFFPISEESFQTDEPNSEVYLHSSSITAFNDRKMEYRTYFVNTMDIYNAWMTTKKSQPVLSGMHTMRNSLDGLYRQ